MFPHLEMIRLCRALYPDHWMEFPAAYRGLRQAVINQDTDTQAWVLCHAGTAFVGVRGTEADKARDILTDASAWRVNAHSGVWWPGTERPRRASGRSRRLCHAGFHAAAMSVADEIESVIGMMRVVRIHMLGHSLGGAVVTGIADYLSRGELGGLTITGDTWGSPRYGNRAFCRALRRRVAWWRRTYSPIDIVTHVPPAGYLWHMQTDPVRVWCRHGVDRYTRALRRRYREG